ncbi:MAG: FAD-dependent oxidoreductase, partial [Campylobacteraceae bacterium]|nr:FAD-dependent oxidoreductase [Campylobacteraceae bacterium]
MMIYDYLIIGGGIIGLNIARALKLENKDAKIVLIEKEKDVGMHSSGRNSGVLHAGFYYSANSLKAKFARDGNASMQEFCVKRKIHINKCAKVIVAQNDEEVKGLEELKRRGDINKVELHWLSEVELSEKFPLIKTHKKALFSPTTATIDPKVVTLEFKKYVQELGVEILCDTAYIKRVYEYEILTSKGSMKFKKLINCAGLYADKIAKDFNFGQKYVIIPFKGIYLKDKHNVCGLTTNVYPVPNLANPFLGVHYTYAVENDSKIGPTAIPAFWRENDRGI